jgi:hypothetical protein
MNLSKTNYYSNFLQIFFARKKITSRFSWSAANTFANTKASPGRIRLQLATTNEKWDKTVTWVSFLKEAIKNNQTKYHVLQLAGARNGEEHEEIEMEASIVGNILYVIWNGQKRIIINQKHILYVIIYAQNPLTHSWVHGMET